ncbi:uncharacterized protein LOC126897976 [Daktulosphaira vitifoliae]|uniref:uncharacterized protein LOC126897976 n=1 Tax=Daktulosphaira vitifoliae TaxID=58002 RepID=UPI0021A9B52C|nr:uncharacterized protein LOC126897976 [Daktulosphaira vitifoliae]
MSIDDNKAMIVVSEYIVPNAAIKLIAYCLLVNIIILTVGSILFVIMFGYKNPSKQNHTLATNSGMVIEKIRLDGNKLTKFVLTGIFLEKDFPLNSTVMKSINQTDIIRHWKHEYVEENSNSRFYFNRSEILRWKKPFCYLCLYTTFCMITMCLFGLLLHRFVNKEKCLNQNYDDVQSLIPKFNDRNAKNCFETR